MSVVARNLDFRYARPDAPPVLKGVSFAVAPGALCGVVGPSGSGKSTLLQLVAGLLSPPPGSIQVCGLDPSGSARERRALRGKVGIVFQYPERNFFCTTVREEISFGMRRLGLDPVEIDARLHESLAILPHAPGAYLDRSPLTLSGGEQRAVALAVALSLRPHVLLLDEPAAGLDARTKGRLLDYLDAWRRRTNASVLLVSHDMADTSRRAERVLALEDGRVAFQGTPSDFFVQEELLTRLELEAPTVPTVLRSLSRESLAVTYPLFEIEAAAESITQAITARRGADR